MFQKVIILDLSCYEQQVIPCYSFVHWIYIIVIARTHQLHVLWELRSSLLKTGDDVQQQHYTRSNVMELLSLHHVFPSSAICRSRLGIEPIVAAVFSLLINKAVYWYQLRLCAGQLYISATWAQVVYCDCIYTSSTVWKRVRSSV